MEIAYSLRRLWRRRLWVVVVLIVALVCSIALTEKVDVFPPALHSKKGLEGGAASISLLVDSPHSAIGNLNSSLDPLVSRAALIALLTKSDSVRQQIVKRMGISPNALSATVTIPNPYSPSLPPTLSAGARANALIGDTSPFQISTEPEISAPIVDIYAQAPTGKSAIALANATSGAVRHFVSHFQHEDAIPKLSRLKLRTLGEATGGDVNSGTGVLVAILAFIGIFILGCLGILAISRIVDEFRIDRDLDEFRAAGREEEAEESSHPVSSGPE